MSAYRIILAVLCATLVACAQNPGRPDPLQNTKKLAAEGHVTLYNNGAFEVPMTTIHLIPPGPDALDLVSEMWGMRARQSFQESLKHARESIDFMQAGIDKSKQTAQAVSEGTDTMAGGAREVTHFGMRMAGKSPDIYNDMVGVSVTYADKTEAAMRQAGAELADNSLIAGGQLSENTTNIKNEMWAGTKTLAKETSAASLDAAERHVSYAVDRFAQGWAVLPKKLGEHWDTVSESASLGKFTEALQQTNEWRSEQSGKMTDIMIGTVTHWGEEARKPFGEAAREINEVSLENGTLPLLKSMRWVVQGIFWDATIKPAGKLAGASLGFVTVNAVAFPAMVTVKEGVAVANVAVQVTWNTAASAYDVTAPTATAALAGMFGAVELVGGQALAKTELVAGAAATTGTYAVGKTAAGITKGGGYLTGKALYVAAPLSSLGIKAGGATIGVVAGGTTAITGASVATAGAVSEAATRGTGFVAEKTVLVGGSVASITAGTALGTYELTRAVVVPSGYKLGSGLVLGYGALSQAGAQVILAVSDASYMVLSLEGPNWVLYAVKDTLGLDPPPGEFQDLKAMQQAGDTITAVPVSDEEMKRIVSKVPGQFPVMKQAASTAP